LHHERGYCGLCLGPSTLPNRIRSEVCSLGEPSFPNETSLSCFCAFLCDSDGLVIRDFGEEAPCSSKTISARLLVSRVESERWMDFREAVRTRGTVLGWGIRIPCGVPARRFLLNGSQTPFGILVFATLTLRPSTSRDGRSASSAATPVVRVGSISEDLPNLLPEAVHDVKNSISSVLSLCEYFGEYSRKNRSPDYMEMIAALESSARTVLELSDRMYELSGRIAFLSSQNMESARRNEDENADA
jgi:hypothetical protein